MTKREFSELAALLIVVLQDPNEKFTVHQLSAGHIR
jgi:hypothetical protein